MIQSSEAALWINVAGYMIIIGLGLAMLGLRRIGLWIAFLGFCIPVGLAFHVTIQPVATALFDQWLLEQPAAIQALVKLAYWAGAALLAILAAFGVLRVVASIFIGRNAADSMVANLASDALRGLFRVVYRSMFWWRR